MSAFKRKGLAVSSRSPAAVSGTKISAYNSALLLSTGVSSLDDILGGGLPIGSLLVLEEDATSSYSKLLLKFWLAQGLICKQRALVISHLLHDQGSCRHLLDSLPGQDATPDQKLKSTADPMKIAFRYDNLSTFQTSVDSQNTDEYCSVFDITKSLTRTSAMRQACISVDIANACDYLELLNRIKASIEAVHVKDPSAIIRIGIHSLGNILWHDTKPESAKEIYCFLLNLRKLLRERTAAAILTIPAYALYQADKTLLTRIRHAADASLEFASFIDQPHVAAALPRYAGLLHVHKLPTMGTLLPASTKLSVLRGLASDSHATTTGAGGLDNNLAFRLKRKRFVIETLHLDIGGSEKETVRKVPASVANQDLKEDVNEVDRPSKVRFQAPKAESNDAPDW